MLAAMAVPVYHFERWLLCVVRLDYTPKNPLVKKLSKKTKASSLEGLDEKTDSTLRSLQLV